MTVVTNFSAQNKQSSRSARNVALVIILVIAALLRLTALHSAPPALHVDEASNAWNAYTILKTGLDQHGVALPVFYTRAFGENRSTTYMYALVPFQLIGGLDAWTARLPAAIGGILTVWLLYYVGARLFGPCTGLIAAALLAITPWHLQISRYAFEASLVPMFILGFLAALIAARLTPRDAKDLLPRPAIAAMAGVLLGISCYGYWALRLFLPVFVGGLIIAAWRRWRVLLATKSGRRAIAWLLLFASVIAVPLLWQHLSDPEMIKRGHVASWVWNDNDDLGQKVLKVAARYPDHYGLDFLFLTGDADPAISPPEGFGLLGWYMAPLILCGIVVCCRKFKSSDGARILLFWFAVYPTADLLNAHVSLHSLRSLPGLPVLVLLAAVGAAWMLNYLMGLGRRGFFAVLGLALALILVSTVNYLVNFLGAWPLKKQSVLAFGDDTFRAAQWLKPRINLYERIFFTGSVAHPYIITLVALNYDPEQWFRERREVMSGPLPNGMYSHEDVYLSYGKLNFIYPVESSRAAIAEVTSNNRPDRVVFIVRPGELGLHQRFNPVQEILGPDGEPTLWIFDITI